MKTEEWNGGEAREKLGELISPYFDRLVLRVWCGPPSRHPPSTRSRREAVSGVPFVHGNGSNVIRTRNGCGWPEDVVGLNCRNAASNGRHVWDATNDGDLVARPNRWTAHECPQTKSNHFKKFLFHYHILVWNYVAVDNYFVYFTFSIHLKFRYCLIQIQRWWSNSGSEC